MYKTAVVCYYEKEFKSFIDRYNLDESKYVWIPSLEKASGKFFNGYIEIGTDKLKNVLEIATTPLYEVEEVLQGEIRLIKERKALLDYIEYNTKRSIQDCLDYLEEKRKVLYWLIDGYGKTGLPLSAVRYLSIYKICELYHVDIDYFNKI